MGRSSFAVVETEDIGDGTTIGEFSVVRAGVTIGDRVVIHAHVVLYAGTRIGDDVEIFPGSIVGKEPRSPGTLSRPIEHSETVSIGDGCVIGPHAVIYAGSTIGRRVLVGDHASIREGCSIGDNVVVGRHVTVNYDVSIGAGTKIMDHSWLAGSMEIGRDVFISGGVMTANDDSMGADPDRPLAGPSIADRARVGAGVILLPGRSLGPASVVAAGAVVVRDVEAGSTVRGVPARPAHDGSGS